MINLMFSFLVIVAFLWVIGKMFGGVASGTVGLFGALSSTWTDPEIWKEWKDTFSFLTDDGLRARIEVKGDNDVE